MLQEKADLQTSGFCIQTGIRVIDILYFLIKIKCAIKIQMVYEYIDYKGKKFYFKRRYSVLSLYDSIKQFIKKPDFYADLRSEEIF
ncbi:hypothetical protein ATZ36_09635 [Candidatus Endomicrobiellum trichonymphae]|uniref:Uncharacterized protein n=1 Tax=Endomicrobium trichonymphae TaxID=1408204 RepID=A0A1E5IGB0_ENDTX|nr:hypothetical protein ATZ36_09635 [Candidatus Endomicrobium trichonymphae]